MNESPTNLKLFAIWNYFWIDLFVEYDTYKSVMLKTDWCLFGMPWASKDINTPNAVSGPYSERDLSFEYQQQFLWGWHETKSLKCFGKCHPFEQSNFLCQCEPLALQTFPSIPCLAYGRQTAPNPFCVVLSPFMQYCSGLVALNSRCRKRERAGLCSLAVRYAVVTHIGQNRFVSAALWQLKP